VGVNVFDDAFLVGSVDEHLVARFKHVVSPFKCCAASGTLARMSAMRARIAPPAFGH
jgi:hypothetical protein